MKSKRVLVRGVAAVMAAGAVTVAIGGAEAAGFFKEATGYGSESDVAEVASSTPSGSNGKPIIIKVPGGTVWGDPKRGQPAWRYE